MGIESIVSNAVKENSEYLSIAEGIVKDLFDHNDCSDLMDRAKDRKHSARTRELVLQIEPNASVSLQIAALAHDIDRTIEARRVKRASFKDYDKFKKQHAKESAKIICERLGDAGFPEALIDRVRYLVEHHEVGGDREANILKDADSLTFFEMDIYPYFDARGLERTKAKIEFSYKRLSPNARQVVKTFHLKDPKLQEALNETIKLNDSN